MLNMKQFFLAILFLAFVTATSQAGEWKPIRSLQPSDASVALISSDISTSVIHFKVDGFFLNEVKTPRGNAYTVSLGNASPMLDRNAPDMPKMTTSLIIPDMAMMDVEVVSSSFVDYADIEIAPSKGNLTRDIDPATVPYEYGRVYNENKFYPGSESGLRDPFILRDYRGQTVIAYPFQYNPVTKVLRVYTDITLKLKIASNNGYNTINRNQMPTHTDMDFDQAYKNVFLNTSLADYTPLNDYGRMLVISQTAYMGAMQPFVDWKNSMGIKTEMVDLATVGTTAAAIKTFVENYYNTSGLTFLLLVGDAPQLPTNTTGDLGGPSDNAYGYLVGNDHYPDIFVGRFSAENVGHVNTMVERTLEYEKSPLTTTNWFDKGVGLASDQGPGDDNEMDYEHMRNIRTDLMGYTYTSVAELYDGAQGGEDQSGNPTTAMVSSEVNAGRSVMNYVGHGSDNAWSTSGFSSTNVNALSNNHMWPFIFSVACVNGNFVGATCFAESWLRARNANGPTGAVATIMSTINQSWNPPMDGEDEMDDILVESYPTNIKHTFGGITMNGCFKMNETYGTGGDEMTDTWTIFGDPSVMVRTALPSAITATHENQIFLGTTTIVINSPVEGALAALSIDNQFITAGIVNNGLVTLTFPAFQSPDTVQLVLTAYNYIPYMATLAVLPNNGPYLIYNTNTIGDASANNNGQADYGETVFMDVAFANIGVLNAEDVLVTVSTTDAYLTLLDSTDVYTVIPAHDTIAMTNSFSFALTDNIPDLHIVPFHFTAVSGSETWAGNFSLTAHAGVLKYVNIAIDDSQTGNGNGKADPGEAFDVAVFIQNTGSAPITNANGQISFNDPNLSLLSSPDQNYGNLAAGEPVSRIFSMQADAASPNGLVIPVTLLMTADHALLTLSAFNLVIGQIPVTVIDLDGNHNSGPSIKAALIANSVFAEYKTVMPVDISGYSTLFVCLGVGTGKHVLSTNEGQKLAAFVDAGGRLYMEGGDTWYYDPKTAVHPRFKTNGVMDGGSDLSTETGQAGQFAEGLSFTYTGDKDFIDHISANAPAFTLFKNAAPLYISAVAYDAGTYRTIASAFEFGGLANGDEPSTRNEYMHRIIEFFGILSSPYTANFMGNPINICEGGSVTYNDYSTTGTTSWAWTFPGGVPETSTDENPVVTYAVPGMYDATLVVSNGTFSDTLAKDEYVWVAYCTGIKDDRNTDVSISPNPATGFTTVTFGALTGLADLKITDALGKTIRTDSKIDTSKTYTLNLSGLSEGMYFATITSAGKQIVRKILVSR
jgi:PKD repeat protein